VHGLAQPLEYDAAGRVARVAGLMFDVSRDHAASAQLRQAADRLSLVLDAGGMGIWESDLEHGETIWDQRMYELLGLDPAETQPSLERFLAAVDPEDRDRLRRVIAAAMTSGERYSAEFRVGLAAGGRRRLSLHGQAQRDEAGRIVRMVGISFLRPGGPDEAAGDPPAKTTRQAWPQVGQPRTGRLKCGAARPGD
jgi:PAS domain-containing protein